MAETRIDFTFDFIDPGSYLAQRFLASWCSEAEGVSVHWHPLELRTPASSPIDPNDPNWSLLTTSLAEIAEIEGITFQPPNFVPWSRKAHELALHAQEQGCFDAVHEGLFNAYFCEGRDIGRVDTLVELGSEHGLEPSETRTVLGVDRFLSSVEAERRRAIERGIRGVPTLEAGGKRLEGFENLTSFRAFLDDLVQ